NPIYPQGWIVKLHTIFGPFIIKIVTFIKERGCLRQDNKAVEKPPGHAKLLVIFSTQLQCNVFSKCLRTQSDIHGYIKYPTLQYPNQFSLCISARLRV